MPGLWKEWKAKGRLPTLSTSPLEISPKAGEISTFPQLRPRRRMEKWETKSRFPTFPPPRFLSLKNKKTAAGGLRPRPRQHYHAASVVPFSSAPLVSCYSALDKSDPKGSESTDGSCCPSMRSERRSGSVARSGPCCDARKCTKSIRSSDEKYCHASYWYRRITYKYSRSYVPTQVDEA